MGSNLKEIMDVSKCIVPLRHGGAVNSYRSARALMRLMDREETWDSDSPGSSFLQNRGGTKLNYTITCIMIKATVNDRRTSIPLP
ncbi:hypothetical protein TNCV_1930911 [Trichonephila clavipes]|nr:hypothetical protein TNCV_1930911 [Trichonephila clavipes]